MSTTVLVLVVQVLRWYKNYKLAALLVTVRGTGTTDTVMYRTSTTVQVRTVLGTRECCNVLISDSSLIVVIVLW